MTKDEIIAMARESGLVRSVWPSDFPITELERFAALVEAATLERAANVCEDNAKQWTDGNNDWCRGQVTGSNDCAAAIRSLIREERKDALTRLSGLSEELGGY